MASTPLRLFLVEDEALIVMELSDRLARLGYEVCGTAAWGERAVDQIVALAPDLVLMDIQLAGPMTGVDTAKRLRECIDVPVVFLTAYSDSELLEQAQAVAPYGYLVKPFDEREVHATIQVACVRHRLERSMADANARLEERVRERTADLAASQARLHHLLTQSPAVIYTCHERDNLATSYISDNVREQLGYEPSEFVEQPDFWFTHVHPDDRAAVEAAAIQPRGHDRLVLEYRFQHKDGTYRWMRDESRLTTDVHGNPDEVVGDWVDITDRRLVEESLRRSEAKLAVTLDSIGEAVIAADADGNIVRLNPAAESLTGWPDYEATGRPVSDIVRLVKEDTRASLEVPVERVMATGLAQTINGGTMLVRRDGSERAVASSATPIRDKSGAPQGVVLVFRDVTEERKASHRINALLKELNDLKVALDEHSIVAITDAHGKITYANDKFCAISQYSREQLIGQDHRLINSSFHPKEFIRTLWDTIRSGRIWKGEIRNRARNGSVYWVDTTIVPFLDDEGRPFQYVSIRTDITARKSAEQELRALNADLDHRILAGTREVQRSFSLLQAAINSTAEGLLVVDRQGRITSVNQRFFQLWHVPTELRTTHDSAVLFTHVANQLADPAPFWERLRELHDRPDLESVEHLTLADGRTFERYSRPQIFDGQIVGRVWSCLDLTSRLSAEASLRASEERFRMVWSQSADAFRLTDAEGTIVMVNDAFCQLVDLSRESLQGRPLSEIYLEGDRDRILTGYRRTVAERSVNPRVETEMTLWNGKRLWLDVANSFLDQAEGGPLLLGVFRDVTERRLNELALRASEQRYQRVVSNIGDALVIVDPGGRVVFSNQRFADLFGFSADEASHLAFADCVVPEHRDVWRAHHDRQLQGTDAVAVLECEGLLKDGSRRWFEIRISPVLEDGQVAGTQSAIHDITDRKSMTQRTLRSQRLESIGTLAGGVAHDLNNALAPILLGLEALRTEYPQKSRTMDIIQTSATRGADMVRQLMTFAKGVEGKRVSVQVAHLLRELVKIMKATFPKNVTIELTVEKGLPTVLGDPTQIHQVLLNLGVNARDAMPNGGSLLLSAATLDVDEAYATSLPEARPGRYVIIRVKDTGVGIPEAILDRIFDPFFTTKGPDKGTGLGLATVVGVTKSHGGFLHVQSEFGRGSTFSVFLPADHGILSGDSAPAEGQAFVGSGQCILVVDDEPAVREMAEAVLSRLNFKTVTAEDGPGAIIKAAELKGAIAAVVTDLHMPHMDGVTLVGILRRMLPNVPIIVASGRIDDHSSEALREYGVTRRLDKPFTQKQFLDALRHALQQSESGSVQP